MSISLENTFQYVAFAYMSLLKSNIYRQGLRFYTKQNNDGFSKWDINRPSRRRLNYINPAIQNENDVYLYSGLALESFINKMGVVVFGEETYHKEYERNLGIKKKIISVVNKALSEKFDENTEIIKNILLVFDERDRLVHDKPKVFVDHIPSSEDFYENRITTQESLEILCSVSDDFESKHPNFAFVNGIVRHNFNEYMGNEWKAIGKSLPFENLKFPSLSQYLLFLRENFGYESVNIELSSREDRIIKKRKRNITTAST